MGSNWSKGFTKETHPSVRKISETMKRKRLDNFAKWRKEMKASGRTRSSYPALLKDGDLAEFIGVVLGDGHLSKFPRTEELTVFSNLNNKGFIRRYSHLMEELFDKNPYVAKTSWSNCVRMRIYQKKIKKRLGVPYSPRGKKNIGIPSWILDKKNILGLTHFFLFCHSRPRSGRGQATAGIQYLAVF